MTRTIRVKTTYLAATDTLGARIRVGAPGVPHRDCIQVPYPYDSLDPHMDVARRAFPYASVAYRGDHARGEWFDVTLN